MIKRTVGFFSKFGRQKTRLLTSSSGRSASHSSDERLVTSLFQRRSSETSAEESGSTLEDRRSPQSFEDAIVNLQEGVQFKDSPSRIIVHNDGSAAFYALLLNEDLVIKQRKILEYCHKRSQLKRKLGAVKMEVMITEGNLNYTKEFIEGTSNNKRSNRYGGRF